MEVAAAPYALERPARPHLGPRCQLSPARRRPGDQAGERGLPYARRLCPGGVYTLYSVPRHAVDLRRGVDRRRQVRHYPPSSCVRVLCVCCESCVCLCVCACVLLCVRVCVCVCVGSDRNSRLSFRSAFCQWPFAPALPTLLSSPVRSPRGIRAGITTALHWPRSTGWSWSPRTTA